MKTNKLIININNLSEIEEYKKIGITNFLFAVEHFSVGYKTFKIEELMNLDCNVYLLINRMMDTKVLDEFKKIVPSISFVKGIFFEDIGIYNILKDTNIPLIWNQTQFGTNYVSINSWLDKVESAVISNSITLEEIIEIVNKAKKPIVFNVFAKNMIMYSRRTLLSNFNKFKGLDDIKNVYLKEKISDVVFKAIEDEFGTVIFNNKYFNYINIIDKLNDDNILFYYINNLDLSVNEIKELINDEFTDYDLGFLDKKTIFKVGGKVDRAS